MHTRHHPAANQKRKSPTNQSCPEALLSPRGVIINVRNCRATVPPPNRIVDGGVRPRPLEAVELVDGNPPHFSRREGAWRCVGTNLDQKRVEPNGLLPSHGRVGIGGDDERSRRRLDGRAVDPHLLRNLPQRSGGGRLPGVDLAPRKLPEPSSNRLCVPPCHQQFDRFSQTPEHNGNSDLDPLGLAAGVTGQFARNAHRKVLP